MAGFNFNDNSRTSTSPSGGFNSPQMHTQPQSTQQPVQAPVSLPSRSGEVKVKSSRMGTLFVRYLILIFVGILALVGVAKVVLPTKELSQQEIGAYAQAYSGVTTFPADKAQGVVLAYVESFLTIDPATSSTRKKTLENLSSALLNGRESLSGVEVNTIKAGPFISGIKYNSATDATFTVTANTTALGWVTLGIPVAYSPTTDAFSVIGTPSLMPRPATFTNPLIDDSALGDKADKNDIASAQTVMRPFFEAWGKSDVEALRAYTVPGTTHPRAYVGFNGVYVPTEAKIVSMSSSQASGTFARVEVVWNLQTSSGESDAAKNTEKPVASSEKKAPKLTSNYILKLTKSGDSWKVLDITTESYYGTKDAGDKGNKN